MSTKAAKQIRSTIREWRLASTRNNQELEDIARLVDPVVRGWMNYYGRFYRSKCVRILRHLNEALVAWACWKFKRFRRREQAATHWLGGIARRDPRLFHPAPPRLPDPPASWERPYAQLAEEDALPWTTLVAVIEAARAFLDPVLRGDDPERWSPARWRGS